MHSLETSVAESSPSSSCASSRTGCSQCYSHRVLCCFGGCCLAEPSALQRHLSDVKTECLSRGLGSIIHPWLCCSMSGCPALGYVDSAAYWLPPQAAAPLAGQAASGAGKDMCTNPAWSGELPHPKVKDCVFALLPFSPTVWPCLRTAMRLPKVSLEKFKAHQG